jgi:hypothetical protein
MGRASEPKRNIALYLKHPTTTCELTIAHRGVVVGITAFCEHPIPVLLN